MRVRQFINNRCSTNRLFAAGIIIFIAAFTSDGFDIGDVRGIGVVLMIGAIARSAIKPALQPQVDLYRAGSEVGYAHGYDAGHREARPVVVPLHICSCELQERLN